MTTTKTRTRHRKGASNPGASARLRAGWHEVQGRVATLQTRLRKEQRGLGRRVNEAVHGALAALDIPSRQEVAALTRKVDELTRRIASFRRTRAAA